MRRRAGAEHGVVAHFQRADALHDGDAFDFAPALADFGGDLLHLRQRHRLVSFVFQVLGSRQDDPSFAVRPRTVPVNTQTAPVASVVMAAMSSSWSKGSRGRRNISGRAAASPPLTGGKNATSSPSRERLIIGGEFFVDGGQGDAQVVSGLRVALGQMRAQSAMEAA